MSDMSPCERGLVTSTLETETSRPYEVVKRFMDIMIATSLLVLVFPIMLVIAVAIALDSKGPVLFRQERVGKHHRMFRMLKFRTMRSDAEEFLRRQPHLYSLYVSHGFKLPSHLDPRLTRVGRVLRRTSLDEIPQLLNVVLGDMSLVGPRPLVKEEVNTHYAATKDILLSVRPGMTGLWQVSGRSLLDYPERADIELTYVRTQSLRLDLSILAKTFFAVITGKGAS